MSLGGRCALVTGGTSGIGRACVERLVADGMRVAFTGRDPERGADVAAQTGARFVCADACDREAIKRSVTDTAAAADGRIDVLVLNAGILMSGPLAETPRAAFGELLDVNLTAGFLYARACLPIMRAQGGGAIVHIASDAGIRGVHELAAYSVTKAGAIALSDLLAAEGAPHGIRSNAVCPGDTVPGVQATPRGFEDHAEDAAAWTLPPSGRFTTGAEVAALVAFLARDEAAHISGATIRIDGAGGAALIASTRS